MRNSEFTMTKEHEILLFPIFKIMMEQIKLVKEQEYLRVKLAHTDDFNLAELYKCFSTKNKSFLNQEEFIDGCKVFGLKSKHKSNFINVYNRYKRSDDKLTFKKFSDIFLAHDTKLSLRISERMPLKFTKFPSDKTQVFEHDTNLIIGELLFKLVQVEKQLIDLQKQAIYPKMPHDIRLIFKLL